MGCGEETKDWKIRKFALKDVKNLRILVLKYLRKLKFKKINEGRAITAILNGVL